MRKFDPILQRMLSQQLVAPQFKTPYQLVSWMGAVQAQEYRLMRWAVAMRTKKPDAKAFEKAFNSGEIIRLHLFRGTWQLIAGEDYNWMMSLAGNKARTTILGWMHANNIHLSEEEISKVRDAFVQTAKELHSVTKEDLSQALETEGIQMSDQRVSYHIRMAELDGVFCSGNLHPSKATYSLVSEKIPGSKRMDRDESLKLLAGKYFQSHGPATLEDFVWWSGLGVGDCKRAVELLGPELASREYDGRTFMFSASCRTTGKVQNDIVLLPPYDEYLIGYKSRDIVLTEKYAHKAHNNSGNFYPVILKDGIVCGNWKPFGNSPEPVFFEGKTEQNSVIDAWNNYLSHK